MRGICVVLLALLVLLSACSECTSDSFPESEMKPLLEGYAINNDPLTPQEQAYPIEELRRFFTLSDGFADMLYLDDIHNEFPLTHLRKSVNQERYYIVYPVIEGGKYLVFLNTVLDSDSGEEKAVYWESAYIWNLPGEEDFAHLKTGDTFADVQAIETYTVMPVMSSQFISYSLLKNGNVMECTYTRTEDSELILAEMKLLTVEDPEYPYSGMVPSDLVE